MQSLYYPNPAAFQEIIDTLPSALQARLVRHYLHRLYLTYTHGAYEATSARLDFNAIVNLAAAHRIQLKKDHWDEHPLKRWFTSTRSSLELPLTRLNLSKSGLHQFNADQWHALPHALIHLPHIQHLCLSYNALYRLSDESWTALVKIIKCLPQLRSIDLSYTQLGQLSAQQRDRLMSLLKSIPQLEQLNWQGNRFDFFDVAQWLITDHTPVLSQLQSLDFSENQLERCSPQQLKAMEEWLCRVCPNLKQLNVGGHDFHALNTAQLAAIASLLQNLLHLKQLELQNIGLSYFDLEKFNWLADMAANLSHLNTLDLSNNQIHLFNEKQLSYLSNVLKRLNNLESIDCWGNKLSQFSAEQLHRIAGIFLQLPTLNRLSVRHNALHRLTATQVGALSDLIGRLPHLKELTITQSQWVSKVLPSASHNIAMMESPVLPTTEQLQPQAVDLASNKKSLRPLHTLDIHKNKLGYFIAKAYLTLKDIVGPFTELQTLDLSDNQLYQLSYRRWVNSGHDVADWPDLQHLLLCTNQLARLSAPQWRGVGQFLGTFSGLRHLDLSDNYLYLLMPEQWPLIGQALACATTLEQLDMRENHFARMTPEQLIAFGQALGVSSTLNRVDLDSDLDAFTDVQQLALGLALAYAPQVSLYSNDQDITERFKTPDIMCYQKYQLGQVLSAQDSVALLSWIIQSPDAIFYTLILQTPVDALQTLITRIRDHLFEIERPKKPPTLEQQPSLQTPPQRQPMLQWGRIREMGLIPHNPAMDEQLQTRPDQPLLYQPDSHSDTPAQFDHCSLEQAGVFLYEAFSGAPRWATQLSLQMAGTRAAILWARLGLQAFPGLNRSPGYNAITIADKLPHMACHLPYPYACSDYWYRLGLRYDPDHQSIRVSPSRAQDAGGHPDPLIRYQRAMFDSALAVPSNDSTSDSRYTPFIALLYDGSGMIFVDYTPRHLRENQTFLHLLRTDELLSESDKWDILQAIAACKKVHNLTELLKGDVILTEWYQHLQDTQGHAVAMLVRTQLLPWLIQYQLNSRQEKQLIKQFKRTPAELTQIQRFQLFATQAIRTLESYQKTRVLFGKTLPTGLLPTVEWALLQQSVVVLAGQYDVAKADLSRLFQQLAHCRRALVSASSDTSSHDAPGSHFVARLHRRLQVYAYLSTVSLLGESGQVDALNALEAFETHGHAPAVESDADKWKRRIHKTVHGIAIAVEVGAVVLPPLVFVSGFFKAAKLVHHIAEQIHHQFERAEALVLGAVPKGIHIRHFYEQLVHYHVVSHHSAKKAPTSDTRPNPLPSLQRLMSRVNGLADHEDPIKLYIQYRQQLLSPVLLRINPDGAARVGDTLGALFLKGLKQADQEGALSECDPPQDIESLFAVFDALLWASLRYSYTQKKKDQTTHHTAPKPAALALLDDVPLIDNQGYVWPLLSVIFPPKVIVNVEGQEDHIELEHGLGTQYPTLYDSKHLEQLPPCYASHFIVKRLNELCAIQPEQYQASYKNMRHDFRLDPKTQAELYRKTITYAKPPYQTVRKLLRSHQKDIHELQQAYIKLAGELTAFSDIQEILNEIYELRDDISQVTTELDKIHTQGGGLNSAAQIRANLKPLARSLRKISRAIKSTSNDSQQHITFSKDDQQLLDILQGSESLQAQCDQLFVAIRNKMLDICHHYRLPDDIKELFQNDLTSNNQGDVSDCLRQFHKFLSITPMSSQQAIDARTGKKADSDQAILPSGSRHSLFAPTASPDTSSMSYISDSELQDVPGDGNCFYYAVIDQMRRLSHDFLANVPNGIPPHQHLRARTNGGPDGQWLGGDNPEDDRSEAEIYVVAQQCDVVIAILDTRDSARQWRYFYTDESGQGYQTGHIHELPAEKPIIRIAFTGDHYQSYIGNDNLDNLEDSHDHATHSRGNP